MRVACVTVAMIVGEATMSVTMRVPVFVRVVVIAVVGVLVHSRLF